MRVAQGNKWTQFLSHKRASGIITELRSACQTPGGLMSCNGLCQWLSDTEGFLKDNALLLSLTPPHLPRHAFALAFLPHCLTFLCCHPTILVGSASELWLIGLKIPAPRQWWSIFETALPVLFGPTFLDHLPQPHFFLLELQYAMLFQN